VGKRLLQHERSGMASLVGSQARDPGKPLHQVAIDYLGCDDAGRINDSALRQQVLEYNMNSQAFRLTQRRTVQESQDGSTPGPATSIFKMYGTELQQDKSELMCKLRGFQGYGWSGESFTGEELEWTRAFLSNRAASIYSGSNEIQRNIIAKRVLGLPD
jgi:alkylation response protein AidB-like acyl-CoA dehydrogenase